MLTDSDLESVYALFYSKNWMEQLEIWEYNS